MRAKYGNKKIVRDGETFDSLKEYRRFCDLSLLEKAGKITELQRQVKYVLIPAQREADTIGKRGGVKKGKVIEHECSYIADFVYKQDGVEIVEDVKGEITEKNPVFVIKRKLMLYVHNIRINVV